MASLPMTALPPDEDRSIQISAVMMVGLAIAIVAFALRFFTRWKITKNLGYDDAIIAIALVWLLYPVLKYTVTVADVH